MKGRKKAAKEADEWVESICSAFFVLLGDEINADVDNSPYCSYCRTQDNNHAPFCPHSWLENPLQNLKQICQFVVNSCFHEETDYATDVIVCRFCGHPGALHSKICTVKKAEQLLDKLNAVDQTEQWSEML